MTSIRRAIAMSRPLSSRPYPSGVIHGAYVSRMGINPGPIHFKNGLISELRLQSTSHGPMAFPDEIIVPGFIDTQNNGGFGVDLTSDVSQNTGGLTQWLTGNLHLGVTGVLATLITADLEKTLGSLRSLADYCDRPLENLPDVRIFLEGPFLSSGKSGVHPKRFIMEPNVETAKSFLMNGRGYVNMVGFAPERDENFALTQFLYDHKVIAALAHSEATYEQTAQFFHKGGAMLIHLFNAMSALLHREPGAPGAFLHQHGRHQAGLIADGFHVAPPMVGIILNVLRSQKRLRDLILVTDANSGQGMPDHFSGQISGVPFSVSGGRAVDSNGTLAGSVTTIPKMITNMWRWFGFTLPFHEIINMVTHHPAHLLGISHTVGSIDIDQRANLVRLRTPKNKEEDFQVLSVWKDGDLVYGNG